MAALILLNDTTINPGYGPIAVRAAETVTDPARQAQIEAAGGVLWPASDVTVAAQAAIALKMREGRAANEAAVTFLMIAGALASLQASLASFDVVPAVGPTTVTAAPGQLIVCDTTLGSVTIDLPTLGVGQSVEVKHGTGSLATNSITVVGTAPQHLEQPAPNNQAAPVAAYVIGGASSSTGLGAADAGTDIEWFGGGVTNVLNIR